MRSIEQLLVVDPNYNLSEDMQYQKLIEAKKTLDEGDLPKGVWVSEEKSIGWDEIELKAWNLLANSSRDYKLTTLWAQAYITIHGIEGLEFVLQAILKSLQTNDQFTQEDFERRMAIIRYIDKHFSVNFGQVDINIGGHNPIALYKLESFGIDNYSQFQEILAYISHETSLKLQSIYDKVSVCLKQLHEYLDMTGADNLVKVTHLVDLIKSLLELRSQVSVEQKATVTKQEGNNEIKSLAYYRDLAFTSINEGLAILERVDPQSLIVPFLRKAMLWKDMSLLEIFEDIGSAAQIEAFVSILKESKKQPEKEDDHGFNM